MRGSGSYQGGLRDFWFVWHKWMCRLPRYGRLEEKQVSRAGRVDNKFMVVYLEIDSLGEKIRDVASLPLLSWWGKAIGPRTRGESRVHLVRTRVISTCNCFRALHLLIWTRLFGFPRPASYTSVLWTVQFGPRVNLSRLFTMLCENSPWGGEMSGTSEIQYLVNDVGSTS